MTTTASKVTRQTVGQFALTGQPCHLVVTIQGDTLHFREKGKRRVFSLPIEAAARQALLSSAALPASFALPPAEVPATAAPAPKPAPTADATPATLL